MSQLQRRHGGQAPYGYKWEQGTLTLDPHETPVRKYIYELFLQHKRKKAVARILNSEGYRTRRRAKFSGMTIERILKDPIGKGQWRRGHARSLGKNQPWIARTEEEWKFEKVPATIDEVTWEKCQELLNANSDKTVRKEARHLFRDYIQCHCGARMKVPSQRAKYHCPSCGNSIEQGKVEDIFISQIVPFKIWINRMGPEKIEYRISDLKRRVTHLAREATTIQTLLQHYQETASDKSEYKSKTEALIEQLRQIKASIPKLQIASRELQLKLQEGFEGQQVSLADRWLQLSFQNKREILQQIVGYISVGESAIKIVFTTPLSVDLEEKF